MAETVATLARAMRLPMAKEQKLTQAQVAMHRVGLSEVKGQVMVTSLVV